MNRGIVITTSEHTKDWLAECVASVIGVYPVTIVKEGYELGGIAVGKQLYDEFIFLMDTCVVKDTVLFDRLFEMPGHVFLTNGGYHYMGKFVSNDLPEIPKIHTKEEAIELELTWLKEKERTYFTPDLPVHTDVFEEKHGSMRMRLENEYIKKWKGTWRM